MERSATPRRLNAAKHCRMTRRRAHRTQSPGTQAYPAARASARLRAAYNPFAISVPPVISAGRERRNPETAVTCTSACSRKVTSSTSRTVGPECYFATTTWRLSRVNDDIFDLQLKMQLNRVKPAEEEKTEGLCQACGVLCRLHSGPELCRHWLVQWI